MIMQPSRRFMGSFAVCVALLFVACNCAPVLRYLSVAPNNITLITPGNVESLSVKPGAAGPGATKAKPAAAGVTDISGASCNSYQFSSTGYFSNGTTKDFTNSVVWNSSNTRVATVKSTGLASAVSFGVTTIEDSSGNIVAAPVNLYVDALNFITITPANKNAAAGVTVNYAASGNFTYSDGSTGSQDITSQVAWASSNTEVATIGAATGVATTTGQGTTSISAALCGVTASTNLTVGTPTVVGLKVTPTNYGIAVGESLAFTAVELKSDGTTQAPTHPITWSGSSTVMMDTAAGIAVGVTAGNATITASENGTSYTASVPITVMAATARFNFVASYDGTVPGSTHGGIFGDQINSSSPSPVLTPITPVGAPANPQEVIVHPSGNFLYYFDTSSNVHVLHVSVNSGAISDPGLPAPVAGSTGFNTGTTDPYGRFLYVTDNSGNSVYGFTIAQSNGALTGIPAVTNYKTNLNFPTWVMTDATGKYLYIVNNKGDSVAQFSIDQSSGAITPLTPATIATGHQPEFANRDVNGHIYAAISTNGGTQGVSGFKIDPATGLLSSVGADLTIPSASATFNVTTDPTGHFLYVLDTNSNVTNPGQVFVYKIDPTTGAFGTQVGSAVATGHSPTGLAVDPTGKFMLVDNYVDGTFSGYIVNADGSLTATTPATYPTGSSPAFVSFYTAVVPQ